jgi:flagellar biogenesis protein FliO
VVFRLVKLVIAVLIVLAIAWVGKRFMEAWDESAGASPVSALASYLAPSGGTPPLEGPAIYI